MRRSRVLAVALVFAAACGGPARRAPQQPSADVSGFLDEYSLLRPGGAGEVALVFRNPDAQWTSYYKVLLEPVTLWRSGKKSLDAVPETDLLRLVAGLETAVRKRLGADFRIVQQAEPGTMRIRLAITEARATDPILDVLRARADEKVPPGKGSLDPETRRFIEAAHIEGEIRDATTNHLLAAGLDRRREGAPPLQTWADVARAIDFWAERVCGALAARTRLAR